MPTKTGTVLLSRGATQLMAPLTYSSDPLLLHTPHRSSKTIMSSSESSTGTTGTPPFLVGEVVYVNGEGDWRGKICYLGDVHFAKGEWAGVALDHPLGNHDGSLRGSRRYFQCAPDHGIFVRLKRLSRTALIPESLDPGRIGLYKLIQHEQQKNNNRFWRESSPSAMSSTSTYSSALSGSLRLGSSSRECSPLRSTTPTSTNNKRISFNDDHQQLWRSSSPAVAEKHQISPTAALLHLGDRIIVASSIGETKTGILRYLGPVAFAEGEWAGIELFHPLGKNDGTVRGRQYFVCEHPFGLFVPRGKVESSPANKTIGRRLGTRDNLTSIQGNNTINNNHRGYRAGSYDDYY